MNNHIVNGRLVIRPASTTTNKYRAIQSLVDGIKFHSRGEAERYRNLRLLERAGEITNLRLQVKYPIEVNGQRICTYIADFVYTDTVTSEEIVEDFKGFSTPIFRLKKRLMKAVHGIEIQES